MYVFRWNEWNIVHIGEHGVTPWEAEHLVNHARRPFPQSQGDDRYLVMGQLPDVRMLRLFSCSVRPAWSL